MKYYLAVDGGGSKTTVVCSDQNQQIIGIGDSGPTSLAATSMGAASFNLREGVRQAIEQLPKESDFEVLVMGLAGMDSESEKQTALQVFSDVLSHLRVQQFVLVNDIVIALESGSDAKNAIALISGTGSNCYGRNKYGQEAKAGGMDFLLTDQGSGHFIGGEVLKTAVKSYDGRGAKTVLEKKICDYFHIDSILDLKQRVYNPHLTKPEIADLALICFEALAENDQEAKRIIDEAISELVLMAKTVAEKLLITQDNYDLVLAGKIATNDYVRNALVNKIKEISANVQIVIPEKDPVYGALKMSFNLGNY